MCQSKGNLFSGNNFSFASKRRSFQCFFSSLIFNLMNVFFSILLIHVSNNSLVHQWLLLETHIHREIHRVHHRTIKKFEDTYLYGENRAKLYNFFIRFNLCCYFIGCGSMKRMFHGLWLSAYGMRIQDKRIEKNWHQNLIEIGIEQKNRLSVTFKTGKNVIPVADDNIVRHPKLAQLTFRKWNHYLKWCRLRKSSIHIFLVKLK